MFRHDARLGWPLMALALVVLIFYSVFAGAANKTFTGNGSFSNPTLWNGGSVPAAGDNLRINGICTFDNAANNLAYGTLNVGFGAIGTLNWPAGGTNTLNVTAVSSSTAGSAIDMTNGGTLQIGTSWTTANQTFTPGAGTINWNVTGAASTLPAAITTYNNLTITATGQIASLGVATTVNGNLLISAGTLSVGASNFALGVKRNFTNNATFTQGTGTVTLNGTAAQAIAGTTTTTFNNLTISNASAAVSATSNFNVNGTLNMNGGATLLSPSAAVLAGGTGTLTGTGTVQVTRTAATADFSSQYTISNKTLTNLTVEYIGTAAQSVSALTYGGLKISNTSAAVSAAANFSVNGTLTMNGAATVLSPAAAVLVGGTGTLTGTGTVQVTRTAATADFSSQYTITNQTLTNLTVEYIGTAAQTVSALTYGSLKVSNTSAAVSAAANFSVNGTLTMNGAATLFSPSAAVLVGGTGTLTGTGTVQVTRTAATADFSSQYTISNKTLTNLTVEYNGAAAQTLSALTYGNLKINNANGVTLIAGNATAGGTLTLTNGVVTTGLNTLITSASCAAPSVSRTNGWVNGTLRKAIPAGASTCTFEIGDANNYTPVVLVFVAGTGAGNLTGSTTGGDHPQLGSSGIDATNSVNRYWTFTNAGVTLPAAGYSATFNFINGSPVDVDNLAQVGSYVVEEWNGSLWFPTTLSGSCTATPVTNLCKQITGETVFGDFAIGASVSGINPGPGAFNAFETGTASGAVLGRIFTKIAGPTFSVSIVAVSNNGVNLAPSTNALTVEVIDSTGTPGAFSATSNCWSGWTSVQSQSVSSPVAWVSGRISVIITAPTQAVRDARIRVTQGALQGCSTDRFSIRPTTFTISSSASNNGSSGTPAIKTGATFSITAQPLTNTPASITAGYDGAPTLDNTKVVGSPNAGTIGGSFSAASGGAATGSSFYYSEVGNFGLNINAVVDSSFTGVDQSIDCNSGSFSNTADGAGKYGCSFGNDTATGSSDFGRFIPDNFAVSVTTPPQFTTACGTFNYAGQPISYATAPVITVTARNGTNNTLTNATTRNYADAYMKLTYASLAASPYDTQAGRYSRFDALGGGITPGLDTTSSGFPDTSADPAISFPTASLTSGVGTLTFGTGTAPAGLSFTRSTSTLSAPFNADIALKLNVVDNDNVTYALNPVSFGTASSGSGIAFSSGNGFRYGIVRLQDVFAPLNGNASGNAPVTIQAQYWNGTAFATNTLDNCTSFAAANFKLYNHAGAITSGNVSVSGAGTLASGIGQVNVVKGAPPITSPGSVHICFDLDSSSTQRDTACVAATPANRPYLQGAWAAGSYDKDPNATVGFGIYGSQPRNFIFFRENY